jgi:hypothetical protein
MLFAWNSDLFQSSTVTEYTEAKRCALVTSSGVGHDVKTGRPIKKDSDGKWQWYDPLPSDLTFFQTNRNKTNYRVFGEAGRVSVWVADGDSKGWLTGYTDCVIADSKNWACKAPFETMTDGISDNAHHIGWWKWQANWVFDFFRTYDHRWYVAG